MTVMEIGAREAKLRGVDPATTRAFNRSVVLARIKSQGPVSRAAISRSTTLAKATVSVIVDELLASGLVVEVGVGSSSKQGGRPPILLQYNGRSELLVGVHVGVQRTTAAVATGAGVELVRRSAATSRDAPEVAMAQIAGLVRGALQDVESTLAEVVAIGLCLPGLTDPARGLCLFAPNLGWRDVPVRDLLAAELATTVPVRVQNTTQAVAVAETLEGAGQGAKDVLVVYVGTGVGAALVHDGTLLSGTTGIAGELGHCAVPGATRPCSCGKAGCLETIVSAGGIRETVLAAVADGAAPPSGFAPDATTQDVARWAGEGDPVCAAAVEGAGRELGRLLAWAVTMLNPARVIVAGGVADVGELLVAPVRAAVQALALPESAAVADIRQGALGQEGKVRGAILTALLTWQGAAAQSLGR